MRRSGFTLVELLVVIGIISLLISILLPSLARAREAANTIQCASNMRQIGQATFMYTQEWDNYLPSAEFNWYNNASPPHFRPTQANWRTQLVGGGYLGSREDATPWVVSRGSVRIFRCPTDQQVFDFPTIEGDGKGTSYIANNRVFIQAGHFGGGNINGPWPFKWNRYRNPAQKLMLTEKPGEVGLTSVGLLPGNAGNPWNAQRIVANVAWRHGSRESGRVNVLFVDGHVDTLPTREVIEPAVQATNGNFSNPDPQNLWGLLPN